MSWSIVHSEKKQTPVAWSAKPFGQELDPAEGECYCSLFSSRLTDVNTLWITHIKYSLRMLFADTCVYVITFVFTFTFLVEAGEW